MSTQTEYLMLEARKKGKLVEETPIPKEQQTRIKEVIEYIASGKGTVGLPVPQHILAGFLGKEPRKNCCYLALRSGESALSVAELSTKKIRRYYVPVKVSKYLYLVKG